MRENKVVYGLIGYGGMGRWHTEILSNVTNQEVDDGFTAILTFEGGTEVLVEVGTNNYISLLRWYVLDEDGTAVIRDGAEQVVKPAQAAVVTRVLEAIYESAKSGKTIYFD